MASYVICFCLVRLALPLCLTASALFRQNLFSFIYLLLFFFSPWIRVPTIKHWKGCTQIYLMVVLLCSVTISLAQFIFQIVLVSFPPYGKFLENCSWIEKVLRHIGFVRLDTISSIRGVQALGPDVLMFLTSIAVYVICKRATTLKERTEDDEIPVDITAQMKESRKKRNMFLIAVGKYVSLITLCIAGSLQPSALNGIYFVAFLGSVTWWACYKDLQKSFAVVLHILVLITSLHICALFSMQLQYLQEIVADRCNICRYLGLKTLITVDCLEPNNFHYADDDIPYFLNPVILMWMYYVLALEARLLIKPPLIGSISPKSKYQSTGNPENPRVLQDAMGSVIITERSEENIHLQPLNDIENAEDTKISPFEILLDCITSLFQVINKSAYIATNIIMMAWSIMYHSWLTFVLLLWASLLWMIPNQRRAMLRSSPFLVFYAELLLIAQYIYGIDLTDKELPQEVQGINLKQLGIEKPIGLVCKPLFIKILFTTMFWITLRQFMQERYEHRSTSTLQDLAAPLQVTVNTATSGFSQNDPRPSSLMTKLGDFFKYVLTRCLIWIVAIMLLVIGLTGTRMTLFRIVYTALFLIFVIIFQVSYKIWRKIMYGFWLTVIVYSMSILVLVYTYQFDNFSTYWENFGVPNTLQLDIGLERFETGELFVRLVPPTFFLIITVIQLHYFHKDFLEISDIKVRSASHLRRSSAAFPILSATSVPSVSHNLHKEHKQEEKLHSIIVKKMIKFGKKCKSFLDEVIELGCLFLELHILRIMLISIMLLCVYDVSTLHFGLLLLITIALPFGDRVQLVVTHICVIIVSCLILAKMIYQIDYIKHDVNNVNCTVNATITYGNETFIANDVKWMGFQKSCADHLLGDLLKGYIGIIVVATILAFVNTRQIYMRRSKGQSSVKPTLMFPGVTRSDADKNVALCLKYIFNYGFYKFGVEVCLMTLVALVATRMDFFAVLYSFWLCLMFAMTRDTIMNVWSFFKIFMIIILPLQYALAVGLPPTLCIEYPWYSDKVLARLQHWMFLPDPLNPPETRRLICDFILLMMVCRQSMVFNIEKQAPTIGYPGGSNKDISKEVQDPNFVNPVPDHITYIRSWLDIFKRVVMGGFMWFTLAVVFLAGTNRVNIFSVGYLCGSFIFLWQGEEMYLRPLKAIIKWWNFLLAFNVFVITVKALLQIAGCIFIDKVERDAVWALQLFGIACINDNQHLEHEESTKSMFAEDVSLAWDGVCFGFIIMLRRLFNSHYFVHLVNEAKAMALLASRGAELIEELRLKQITDQQEEEYEILEKIKKKMERIKATQQKIKGETFKQPRNHHAAILSGDYYMFEEFDDELDLLEEEKDESPSVDSEDSLKRLTLNELLAAAMKTDVQQAIGMAQKKKDNVALPRKKSSFFSIPSRTSRLDQATSQPMSDETLPSPAESFYSTERREIDRTDEALNMKQDIEDEIIESVPSDEEELSSEDKDKEQLHVSRWYAYFRFAIAFIESTMETFSKKLNTLSRDYRFVMRVLSLEKKTLKESPSFNRRVRLDSSLTWEPVPLSSSERTALSGIQAISLEEMDQQELSASSQPAIVRLILSAWYSVISHSDLVCYFMVFILQMKSATILSLPLPLMVFLWGTLSVPRPTKTFWVTMIAYTEVIVIVKCMFQFDFVPWNQQAVAENAPFFPPRIIGIEGKKHYAIYDLLLLLIIFFHRFMLKSLGLWKSTYEVPNEYVKGEQIYELMEDEDAMSLTEHRRSTKLVIRSSVAYDSRIKSHRHESIVTAGGLKLQSSVNPVDDDRMHKTTLIVLKTENAILLEHFPRIILMGVKRYLFGIQSFFQQLLSTSLRVTTDVYAYMFMCDFFNLIVLIIGFASFGTQQGDGGVSSYLKEDKVPIPFLIMTILQFGLIIIDRALFLRKYILGKVVFQFFLVFGIHIWMFFILPAVTDRPFNAALPPQMWYMVKCIYLLLSAYQIRSGYPTRILGNFLCKKYNIINMILFKGFMLIPFLFELRALMDWIWTDTSMTLFDWLKMEDIFGNIFQLKCSRRMEAEYPQPRGERKSPIIKYLMGGGLLFIVIGIIWFPLVFFALGSTVGEPNTPYEVDLNLRIGTYQPIFKMSAQNSTIYRLSDVQFTQFANVYKKDKVAQTFLSNYDHDDIGVAIMNRNSTTIWTISPPDQKRLIEEMQSDIPIIVKLTWTIRRITNDPKIPGEIAASKEWTIQGQINNQRNPVRDDFVKVLNGSDTKNFVMLNYLLPKFLKVTNQGQANAVNQLMDGKDSEQRSYRNISLKLYSGNMENNFNSEEWWEMSEVCNDSNYKAILQNIPLQDSDNLVVYTFNDKSFPSTLTFISGAGIIGLYTTLVLIASNIVRGFFTGVLATIMFDDLPNVDRILQLCLDIYLVRESGELALEEDLFAKLIFLYRSPETLIKWTRPREEGEGEGDGGDEGNSGAVQPVEEQ